MVDNVNFYTFIFQLDDVIEAHSEVCPNFDEPRLLQLSLDGVQESRSSSNSLDVYSIKFKNCRNVYPLTIVRPINKFPIDYKPLLKAILDQFHDENCILWLLIADNPKRAILREALNHASNYACEYCTNKAVQYSEGNDNITEEKKKNEKKISDYKKKISDLENIDAPENLPGRKNEIELLKCLIEELKKRNLMLKKKQSHSVWPESTFNGPARTKESILETVQLLEDTSRSQLSADDVKGICGRSLLLDVDGFDFVLAIPTEYMHTGCLGVVRRYFFGLFI